MEGSLEEGGCSLQRRRRVQQQNRKGFTQQQQLQSCSTCSCSRVQFTVRLPWQLGWLQVGEQHLQLPMLDMCGRSMQGVGCRSNLQGVVGGLQKPLLPAQDPSATVILSVSTCSMHGTTHNITMVLKAAGFRSEFLSSSRVPSSRSNIKQSHTHIGFYNFCCWLARTQYTVYPMHCYRLTQGRGQDWVTWLPQLRFRAFCSLWQDPSQFKVPFKSQTGFLSNTASTETS